MKPHLFFPRRLRRQMIWVVGCLIFLVQCKKAETPNLGPDWYSVPANYFYDVDDGTGIKEAAAQLSIFYQEVNPKTFLFIEQSPDPNAQYYRNYFGLGQQRFTRTAEGLYGEAATSCSVGPLSSPRFQFLAIPAVPKKGAVFPLYGCGRSSDGSYTVMQTDTTITVPAGTFETFCLRHQNGDRSWWNLEKGLVLFQVMKNNQINPPEQITLSLRRVEFH